MIDTTLLRDNMEIIRNLRELPILKSFGVQALNEILKFSRIWKYKIGELIIEEGNYDSWIYFLISGQVKIVKEGKEISVLKRKGDIFGEMGAILGSPRSASVYAMEETVCLAMDISFDDKVSDNYKVTLSSILYRVFAEVLADRLRLTTKELIGAKEEIKRLTSELNK